MADTTKTAIVQAQAFTQTSGSSQTLASEDQCLLARDTPIKQVTKFNKPFSPRKQYLFNQYEKIFSQSPAVLIFQHNNLPESEWANIRRSLSKDKNLCNAKILTIRGGIAKAVVRGTRLRNMKPLFNGPVCVVYWNATENDSNISIKDAVVGSVSVAEKTRKLVYLGGVVFDQLMDSTMIKKLAVLPTLDQSRGQLVGVLETPAQKIHRLLSSNQQRLVSILKQHSESESSQKSE
ncbi:hypothetical protein H4219_002323 [Mycoemilia scoparia]|uniref:Ribosomal protein L10 n=1 Tax=Mycoemilia scoparia TaxID=417184 RepID=A0A9W8A769_9FUNG|nr:hypothetical protein H4219_002323 [Mycoemilia scoparia]